MKKNRYSILVLTLVFLPLLLAVSASAGDCDNLNENISVYSSIEGSVDNVVMFDDKLCVSINVIGDGQDKDINYFFDNFTSYDYLQLSDCNGYDTVTIIYEHSCDGCRIILITIEPLDLSYFNYFIVAIICIMIGIGIGFVLS